MIITKPENLVQIFTVPWPTVTVLGRSLRHVVGARGLSLRHVTHPPPESVTDPWSVSSLLPRLTDPGSRLTFPTSLWGPTPGGGIHKNSTTNRTDPKALFLGTSRPDQDDRGRLSAPEGSTDTTLSRPTPAQARGSSVILRVRTHPQ